MTITDRLKIDIIANKPGSDVVKLVIADHLEWDDLDRNLQLLQEKINTYLEFIESGQLLEVRSPPIPREPRVTIAVHMQYAPPSDAQDFFSQAQDFLAGIGVQFSVEHRPARI